MVLALRDCALFLRSYCLGRIGRCFLAENKEGRSNDQGPSHLVHRPIISFSNAKTPGIAESVRWTRCETVEATHTTFKINRLRFSINTSGFADSLAQLAGFAAVGADDNLEQGKAGE